MGGDVEYVGGGGYHLALYVVQNLRVEPNYITGLRLGHFVYSTASWQLRTKFQCS